MKSKRGEEREEKKVVMISIYRFYAAPLHIQSIELLGRIPFVWHSRFGALRVKSAPKTMTWLSLDSGEAA